MTWRPNSLAEYLGTHALVSVDAEADAVERVVLAWRQFEGTTSGTIGRIKAEQEMREAIEAIETWRHDDGIWDCECCVCGFQWSSAAFKGALCPKCGA